MFPFDPPANNGKKRVNIVEESSGKKSRHTAQRVIFALRVSSVNVTKSSVSCGFGHIWCRNPLWKTSFLCSDITPVIIMLKEKDGIK